MEKAYDVKGLLEELKAEGVEMLEESAKGLITGVFNWLEKSADLSENQADDFLAPFYPRAKTYALEKAELINKADNV
jgi:hypothetical protein